MARAFVVEFTSPITGAVKRVGYGSRAAAEAAIAAHERGEHIGKPGKARLVVAQDGLHVAQIERHGSKVHALEGLQIFKIVQRGSKWLVTSEDGSKVLGTHDTEGDAKAQLRAVEAHKHSYIAGRAFAFEGERGPDGLVRADVWDRFTSWGEKIKDGQRSVFDETTLGQMIDNWRARADKLAMCYNHQSAFVPQNGQPAPALAFYDALAIVRNEEIVRCDRLDGSKAAPPDPKGRGDGLYGYRCEVTEIGQKLLPSFRFISPMFNSQGKDEEGNDIGYVLFDVAATNTPFQAGCEITFDKGSGDKKMAKLSKLAKFARMDEGADDKAIRQGILTRMEEEAVKAMEEDAYNYDDAASHLEEMAKHYEDANYEEEEGDKEPPHTIMRKMATKFRRMGKMTKMGDLEEDVSGETGQDTGKVSEKDKAGFARFDDGDKDADDKKMEEDAKMSAFSAIAKRLGVKLTPSLTSTQMLDAINAATVATSEIPSLVREQVKRELDADRRKLLMESTAGKAKELVRVALENGYPKAKEKDLLKLASNPDTYDMAEAAVVALVPNKDSMLFSRITQAGAPTGTDPRRQESGGRDRRVVPVSMFNANFVIDGEQYSKTMCEWADAKEGPIKLEIDAMLSEDERKDPGLRAIAADKLLRQKRPDLWAAAEQAGDYF